MLLERTTLERQLAEIVASSMPRPRPRPTACERSPSAETTKPKKTRPKNSPPERARRRRAAPPPGMTRSGWIARRPTARFASAAPPRPDRCRAPTRERPSSPGSSRGEAAGRSSCASRHGRGRRRPCGASWTGSGLEPAEGPYVAADRARALPRARRGAARRGCGHERDGALWLRVAPGTTVVSRPGPRRGRVRSRRAGRRRAAARRRQPSDTFAGAVDDAELRIDLVLREDDQLDQTRAPAADPGRAGPPAAALRARRAGSSTRPAITAGRAARRGLPARRASSSTWRCTAGRPPTGARTSPWPSWWRCSAWTACTPRPRTSTSSACARSTAARCARSRASATPS